MFKEELLWILDRRNPRNTVWDAEANNRRIAFVHSLGLKCDSVGWCKIALGTLEADEILNKIRAFCEEDGWKARGYYIVTFESTDCEWYELNCQYFNDSTVKEWKTVPCQSEDDYTLPEINAYREKRITPKCEKGTVFVAEKFRNACLKLDIPNVEFCWIKDVGKYAAEQYFSVYPISSVAHLGVDWDARKKGITDSEICPNLSQIDRIFYDLIVSLPDCYLANELTDSKVKFVPYDVHKEMFYTRNTLLLHRDVAKKLLEAKAISEKDLMPAMVLDTFPKGYKCIETTGQKRPTDEFMAKRLLEYEAFAQISRPIRKATEKDALGKLRMAKRERSSDFQKSMPKSSLPQLIGTPYAPLECFYHIADGGYLSDEYEFLSYDDAKHANEEFQNVLKREELIDEQIQGIVIVKCADGDLILLCDNGSVIRFSHEEPTAIDWWTSLPQFFYEALCDEM